MTLRRIRKTIRWNFCGAALPAFLAILAGAQANQEPRFEAFSIKPSPKWTGGFPPIQSMQGGPGTARPNRIGLSYYPLRDMLTRAYGVQPYQISGPGWLVDVKYLQTDTFEVDATLPPGATK